MSFLIWLREHFAEGLLVALLGPLMLAVFIGFLVPPEFKPYVVTVALFFLIIMAIVLLLVAVKNKLQFRLGIRNLIRHKSDTVIAILGFMIGTSIIMASLAIGDTMGNMIENLVYDELYMVDEYIQVVDEDGEFHFFEGENATEISDRIWSVNEEEKLIDGVSWEVIRSAAVINRDTKLFEPSISLRAFSPSTIDAFGGIYADGEEVDYELEDGEVFITESVADLIDGEEGDSLQITSRTKQKSFTVKEVLDDGGRLEFRGAGVLLSFPAIWDLFNITDHSGSDHGLENDWSGGYYNILLISNEGGMVEGGELCPRVIEEVEEKLENIPHPVDPSKNIEITDDKKTSVDSAISAMSTFTNMFLALGTFSIIAGITLILNIFVMLSEERREEMGISRAVGMKRRHLRLQYLYEGLVYSAISSAVGVVLGIVTGFLIIWGVEGIIGTFGGPSISILEYYAVNPMSMVLAFVGGFSITIGTTLLITQLIANLNIVSAIRSTPVPKTKSRLVVFVWKLFGVWNERMQESDGSRKAKVIEFIFDKLVIAGSLIIPISVLFMIIGFGLEVAWGVLLGASLLMIGIGLLIRYFLSERLTYNIVAVLILALWIAPTPAFMENYHADLEMFILSGVFMVTSGVLLLVWNSDLLIWVIERAFCMINFSPASVKTAISYPMKKKFRTGVTIFMFALIIFTITGMSMITHIFNVNIEEFERSVGGGYDIIGISQIREIDDMEGTLSDLDIHDDIDWDETVSLNQGLLRMNRTLPYGGGYDEMFLTSVGISDRFIEHNDYGFNSVAWDLIDPNNTLDRSDRKVWEALKQSPDYVILDSSFGGGQWGPPGMGTTVETGGNITLMTMNGTFNNKTVIGISKLFGYSGVFQFEDYAAEDFGAKEKTLHLIKLKEGVDKREVSNEMRKSLVTYGFYAIVIEEAIEQFLEVQNAFFDLFNAFLALGLIIGIVGLGIVTLRSVYERRHEIGMMRAVGFKRRAVVGSFIGESGFIAGSGLIVGTGLGIILGWVLWRDGLEESLPEFGIPWVRLLIIVGIALMFAILASIPPSYRASRISPADALRYE